VFAWGAEGRHGPLLAELAEWQEDLWLRHTGSRVVLVQVPSGWGRTTVLDRFHSQIADREDAPVTIPILVDDQDLPDDAALQAQVLRTLLAKALRPPQDSERGHRPSTVELLGLDEPGGQVQLGLGIGVLFTSGPTAGLSFLVAQLLAGAAQKTWDASPAGQDGPLARAARAVAAVSVQVPVVVIVDDADHLDADVAVTLVENLTARHGSQVLIVAALDPGGALATALATRVRQGVTSMLVQAAEADPDMGYESRLELARQLCPYLPDAGVRRIAQRTATFAEVFTVAAAPRLADLGPGEYDGEVRAVIDAAVSARLTRPAPSAETAVIAWAGGILHARQAHRALGILGAARAGDDPDVRRWEELERLVGPITPRLAGQVTAGLATRHRRAMAAAFLDEALTIAQAPDTGLVAKVVALRAAHRVRGDLPAPGQLPRAQTELVAALEALGDFAAALQVASEALAGWPADDTGCRAERDALTAAVIRLSHTSEASYVPLAEQMIAEAADGGAATGLEARLWAAIVLLDTPGQRTTALDLAYQVAADLDSHTNLGAADHHWRLLLAYHAGRGALPDLTSRMLAPLITSADPGLQEQASMVQRAVDGPGADIRLQNIILETELTALPPDADDDRLRIHHALAANYSTLGDYRRALAHGQDELDIRIRIQGPRRPDTLTIRADIAGMTGMCGSPAAALALYQDVLPDMEQVLGPGHPHTLATRGNIADWTGESGQPAAARDLYRDLLEEEEQVLGARHFQTLGTRGNFAKWIGECGQPVEARDRYRGLLFDMEQVLGPHHPRSLITRANIADWTGRCGNSSGALAITRNLLPEMAHVLGPSHPETLTVRNNVALWTARCGDGSAALAQFRDLLPDLKQILGPHHPQTLATRKNLAAWTEKCEDAPGALDLYWELLHDQEQILGPDHLDTLTTRASIAVLTQQCEDAAAALRLCQDLLSDLERVFGHDHPNTEATRRFTNFLAEETGSAAGL
jgi:tetratricopeptide (TPR) repeat protein